MQVTDDYHHNHDHNNNREKLKKKCEEPMDGKGDCNYDSY